MRDIGRTGVRPIGRLETLLTVGAFGVFVLLWAGFAYALTVDPTLPDDLWAWVQSLDLPAATVVWVACLPITVGLWIWDAALPPLVGVALLIGIVVWTFASVSGVARLLRAH